MFEAIEQSYCFAREAERGDREESGRVGNPGLTAARIWRGSRWVYHVNGTLHVGCRVFAQRQITAGE